MRVFSVWLVLWELIHVIFGIVDSAFVVSKPCVINGDQVLSKLGCYRRKVAITSARPFFFPPPCELSLFRM